MLLNWLISATLVAGISLDDIIVISMDEPIHRLLVERGVKSVLVTPVMLLSELIGHRLRVFNQVMMTRLAVIRLLNHWGFDVANYDTDAILLKDPQAVFDRNAQSGVIGTFGKFPQGLYKQWGIAVCTAVLVVRSTPQTGRRMTCTTLYSYV